MHLPNFIKPLIFYIFLAIPVHCLADAVKIPDVSLNLATAETLVASDNSQSTIISESEIEESPVVNITSLLRQEQSVARITNNTGDYFQNSISIRGFGDNAVANSLILIDGFPLLNPSLLAPNFNSFALADIESIEIYPGSEGIKWGDQAVGGVVNIITKRPEKFMFNFYGGIGSYNQRFVNAVIGNKFQNGFFLKLSGFYNNDDHYRDHSNQKDQNQALQAGIEYESGEININAKLYGDRVEFPGGLTKEEYDANPQQAQAYGKDNFINFTTSLLQLLNKQILNDSFLVENRVMYYKTIGDGFMFSEFDRSDQMTLLSSRLNGDFDNQEILLGYEGRFSKYDFLSSYVQDKANTLQNNVFANIDINANKILVVNVGSRYALQENKFEVSPTDKTNSLNKVFVTEVGVKLNFNNYGTYYIRRSENFRFPKANEETWLPEGVDSLKMQTGDSYEIGGEVLNKFSKTQVNIYALLLNNEIAFDPTETPENPFGSYSNFDKTKRLGGSLSEYIKLNNKLMMNAQLNYVDARFESGEFKGKKIPAVPGFNSNFGIDYDFYPNFRAKYIALYNGPQYASQDNANVSDEMAGYWLHTVALQHIKKTYNISFEVNNLLDQKYATWVFYDAFSKNNTYYPGTGRTYLLTVKLNID